MRLIFSGQNRQNNVYEQSNNLIIVIVTPPSVVAKEGVVGLSIHDRIGTVRTNHHLRLLIKILLLLLIEFMSQRILLSLRGCLDGLDDVLPQPAHVELSGLFVFA